MKKFIFLFLMLVSCVCFSQSIYNSQQIGQTGRNQNVSRGFWVKSDTFLCNAAIWIPANCGAGKVFTSDANGLASWQTASVGGWGLTGNAGTNPATDFIGTTDIDNLVFKILDEPAGRIEGNDNYTANTSIGFHSLYDNAVGSFNTAFGYNALANTRGSFNTSIGSEANTIDSINYSTAIGHYALVGCDSCIVLGDTTITKAVGIGTAYPSAKLDIRGTVKIVDGTQANGYVLTSDANGLASWQPAGGTGWSLTGNSGTNPATDFVGTTDNADLSFKRNNNLIMKFSRVGAKQFVYIQDSTEIKQFRVSSTNDIPDEAIIGDIDNNFNGTIVYVNDKLKTITTNDSAFNNTGIFHNIGSVVIEDGTQANGYVLTSDANGLASWQGLSGSNGSDIPAYANNAAAFAVLGAGKLYYTDVAGEYIIKVTH